MTLCEVQRKDVDAVSKDFAVHVRKLVVERKQFIFVLNPVTSLVLHAMRFNNFNDIYCLNYFHCGKFDFCEF